MIIGLSGYARSGKDTVSKILVEDYKFTRVAFADPIRNFLYEMNPPLSGPSLTSIVDDYGWDVAKANPEVRRLLQNAGIAARKVFGADFWIKQALKTISPENKVVITDVRFPNEAEMIRSLGGQVWRVIRPDVEAVNDHISEHALSDYEFDFDIYNDSTLVNLAGDIAILMEDLSV